MAFRDNREFISALEKTGDVVKIKEEVDWELEAGAIGRRACETQAPAVLFEKVKDYPAGYRLFAAPLATYRRIAVAMGLPADTPVRQIYNEYERRVKKPLKPLVVKKAPCQENVLLGDDVDLYRFPAPFVHEGDCGRFIGTWHLVITQERGGDWTNWGLYRLMVWNKRYVTGQWHMGNHAGLMFYSKYAPKKQPMPIAMAIGVDPICMLMAVAPLGIGQSEVDYAGGVRQEPVELVKCLTSELMVPAHSEIVLEGELLPDVQALDGPFGEWTGYRTEGKMRPVCRIKAITYRNNPILTMSSIGVPADEDHTAWAMTTAVEIKRHLREHGIPVTDVYNPYQAANQLAVVGVRAFSSNMPTLVKNIVHSGLTGTLPHIVMVVDDDVDVFNLQEVLHAFATKCHPVEGVRPSDHDIGIPLWPFLSPEERQWGMGARLLLDCTWPRKWSRERDIPPRASFKEMYPKALQEKVLREWQSYGFR